jgi:hypothetical protein
VPATLERGPAPISHLAINDFIICVNTEARTNNAGSAIDLRTTGSGSFIDLTSSGADGVGGKAGMRVSW